MLSKILAAILLLLFVAIVVVAGSVDVAHPGDNLSAEQADTKSNRASPVVELAVFADSFLWQRTVARFGASAAESSLRQYVQAIVSEAQQLYHHPSMKPKVDLKVVHFEIWRTRPREMCDSCIEYDGTKANAYKMLDAFKPMQRSGNWDAAFLMTGIEDMAGVGGLAPARGVCDRSNRASLISTTASPACLPHELGHLLDMNHDDPDIASPSEDRTRRGFVWSAFRVKHFQDLLAARDKAGTNCLRTTAPGPPVLALVANPASVYPADMQCKWRDRTFSAVLARQSEFCNGMVCTNGTRIANRQVPVYRTPCGAGRYCAMSMDWSERENRCVNSASEFTSLDKYNYAYGDCRGNNLQRGVRVSLEACATRCDQQLRCKAFLHRNGVCQLKTGYCDLRLTNSNDKSFALFVKEF